MDESVGKSNIGVYVQNMLQQVSSSVEHLLDNLSFIYQSHGINFSIKQNHSVLMRMLAPFELLSQFKVDDNSDIVGNMFYAKCRQSSNCHSERFKTLRDQTEPIIKVENKNRLELKQSNNFPKEKGISNSDIAAERDRFAKRERINTSQEPPRQKRKYERKKVKEEQAGNDLASVLESKYSFPKEKEKQLVGWIENKLKQRFWKVLMNDVKVHAKKLANNNTFSPNLTWVRKFLERYPQLKAKFKSARAYYRANYHAIEKQKRNSQRKAKVSDEHSEEESPQVEQRNEKKIKSQGKKIRKLRTKKDVEPIQSDSNSASDSDDEDEKNNASDQPESSSKDGEYEEDSEEEEEESSESVKKQQIQVASANFTSIATQSIRSCKAFNQPKQKS